MRLRQAMCAAVLVLVGSVSFAAAPLELTDKRIEKGGVGLKFGVENGTTYHIDGVNYSSRIGMGIGVFFEVPLVTRTMMLIAVDFHDIQLWDRRNFMIDVNLGIKPIIRWWKRSKVALKAGGAVGFGYLPVYGRMNSTTYLTVRASTELAFLVNRNYSYLLEFSLLAFPTGGNRQFSVSTKPTASLRCGVMY
jgi:hypothetical protein